MRRRHLLSALGLLWGSSDVAFAQSNTLTVSAAISLKDALEQIQPLFQQDQQPTPKLTYNFGSSGSLQQQIEQGAPVDVFLAAAVRPMDILQEKGLLLAGSRQSLLRNTLVLIAPPTSPLKTFADLTSPAIKQIAIGEPRSVPAGQYAIEALTNLKILADVQPKLILGKDVRQVLTYVESGEVEAGFVYLTDARSSEKVKIVKTVPALAHAPIVYPVAIIEGSANRVVARAFVEFLRDPKAVRVFEQLGFKIVPPGANY